MEKGLRHSSVIPPSHSNLTWRIGGLFEQYGQLLREGELPKIALIPIQKPFIGRNTPAGI